MSIDVATLRTQLDRLHRLDGGEDAALAITNALPALLDEVEAQALELGVQRSRVVNLTSRIMGATGGLTNEAVEMAMREAARLRVAGEVWQEAGQLRKEIARLRSLLRSTISSVRQITRGQDDVARELDVAARLADLDWEPR